MRIAIDAMGSDNCPEPDVAGAVEAARTLNETIILVGDQKIVEAELEKYNTADLSIEVEHAPDAVSMTDIPSEVVKSKPNSSMHIGLGLVREQQADAFVTVGHTGAVLGIAMLRKIGLGRIRGVKRPALGLIYPIGDQPFLIDNGANANCRPEHLLQFGIMGSLYVERMQGIESPRVALISNGEEEGKGNLLIQESIPLFEASGLNYVGNIEPKEFVGGEADVAVTDGFTGNMMLKTAEAVARYISDALRDNMMANPRTILGGMLARPAFGQLRKQLNPDEIGGAPLLGLNGVVIVGHGRSNATAVKHAIIQAHQLVENRVVEAIKEGVKRFDVAP
ncbi:MAG: phosphate acyltransferase PlsX [Chloroflexota bacterium]